jgi:hypothetical protein
MMQEWNEWSIDPEKKPLPYVQHLIALARSFKHATEFWDAGPDSVHVPGAFAAFADWYISGQVVKIVIGEKLEQNLDRALKSFAEHSCLDAMKHMGSDTFAQIVAEADVALKLVSDVEVDALGKPVLEQLTAAMDFDSNELIVSCNFRVVKSLLSSFKEVDVVLPFLSDDDNNKLPRGLRLALCDVRAKLRMTLEFVAALHLKISEAQEPGENLVFKMSPAAAMIMKPNPKASVGGNPLANVMKHHTVCLVGCLKKVVDEASSLMSSQALLQLDALALAGFDRTSWTSWTTNVGRFVEQLKTTMLGLFGVALADVAKLLDGVCPNCNSLAKSDKFDSAAWLALFPAKAKDSMRELLPKVHAFATSLAVAANKLGMDLSTASPGSTASVGLVRASIANANKSIAIEAAVQAILNASANPANVGATLNALRKSELEVPNVLLSHLASLANSGNVASASSSVAEPAQKKGRSS